MNGVVSMGQSLQQRNVVTFHVSTKADDPSRHRYDLIMNPTPVVDSIRFTGKGQVVIPCWLRKELVIEESPRALVPQEGDVIVLKPITPRHIWNLRGSLKAFGL
jgi:hypothetical protein